MHTKSFQAAIDALLTAMSVEFARGTSAACRRTAHLLRSIDSSISTEPIQPVNSHDTPCCLPDAVLELLQASSLVPTVSEITALTQDLQWNESARSHTPISELVGPTSLIKHQSFRVGLFALIPEIDYADHAHPADEVYIVLAGSGSWSLDGGPYQVKKAGDIIDIPSMMTHAMRTGPTPALTLYSWSGDDVSFDHYRFC